MKNHFLRGLILYSPFVARNIFKCFMSYYNAIQTYIICCVAYFERQKTAARRKANLCRIKLNHSIIITVFYSLISSQASELKMRRKLWEICADERRESSKSINFNVSLTRDPFEAFLEFQTSEIFCLWVWERSKEVKRLEGILLRFNFFHCHEFIKSARQPIN